jgi:uncharacterized protein YqgC (DUF456 family)
MTAILWVIAIAAVVIGVIGTVLPALPGPILVFAGLLLAAWADGFTKVGPFPLIILGLITAATHVVDFYLTAKGAKHFGASPRAAIGAAIGVLAGLFFGIPGLLIGPFIGAVIGEYTVQRKLRPAGRAGFGAWLGLIFGIAVKLGLVFGMLAIFLLAFWF